METRRTNGGRRVEEIKKGKIEDKMKKVSQRKGEIKSVVQLHG